MTLDFLQANFDRLRREGTTLAGELTDLSQRATVYRQLFRDSGGSHAFPLIAAHGALWAGAYFRFGMWLGNVLSWQYVRRPALRQAQLRRLDEFANTFRDINRRVCIDTYVNFHFTREFGRHPDASRFVSVDLLEPLNRLHAAIDDGRDLSEAEKRMVFEAHFRHEQAHVVGPTLAKAVAEFDWPLLRAIAMRPIVRFAYFPGGMRLSFHNFASQEERIEKGMAAFSLASEVGWSAVEAALQDYGVLPNGCDVQPSGGLDGCPREVLVAL